MSAEITVKVKLFAAFQEAIATDEIQMELPEQTPVATVFERLATQYPSLAKWRSLIRYAVNLNFVEPDTALKNGDEIALIPPVSGG